MSTPYYEDEWVTLYHGDCLALDAWLEADVLVTDPPYGTGYRSGWSSVSDSRTKNKPSVEGIVGDDDTAARDSALAAWGDRPALVFGTWRVPRPSGTRHRLIWHKRNTNPGMRAGGSPWYSADEEIYVLGAGFAGPHSQTVIPTDEYRASAQGQAAKIGHPTPKPIRLLEHLIERTVGVIADPFAGSGSTLVAAKQLGRRCIGVELEERYCEIAADRLAQDTLFGGAA